MLENSEIWKDVKGYEGLYQVSNLGRIWNVKTQRILKPIDTGRGYFRVHLTAKNGKRKQELIHRLAAIAFIPNPFGLPQVNHKDENPANNCIDNLEWCDSKYNVNYGTRKEKCAATLKQTMGYKDVAQIDMNTNEVIAIFPSQCEASRQTKIPQGNIGKVLRKERKMAGGYYWRYVDADN